jgi:GTP-binding protein
MIDRIEIRVKAGNGGNGAISFRREKFVPLGGPDGGDGGRGGNVIIRADGDVDSLRAYRKNRLYRAGDGRNGSGSRKHGRSGEDLVLTVPPGTVVAYRDENGETSGVADLERPGAEVIAARGGRGGLGNTHFTTSTRQAPHIAQHGEPGEEFVVPLEMRLIADVGVIGYPNAGKSTLLAAASAAHPKIAGYPFTTIEPVLGVVEVGLDTFVLAEIPGLIEGAHAGRGLGHDFLRHALRTKIMIHLVGGDSASPSDDLLQLNRELELYDPGLARRPQLVALNKVDLPEVAEKLDDLKEELGGAGIKAHYISAASGEGVPELMAAALQVLQTARASEEQAAALPGKVFRPRPRDSRVSVSKEGAIFVVSAPELERVVAGEGVSPHELRWQLDGHFNRLGVNKALEKAGVQPGDKVRCGSLEWEW